MSAPLDDGFFAVEEEQLDGEGARPILEHAAELEQRRGARGAVAGADEAELAEQLGVEVAGDDDALRPRPGQRRDDVGHLDRADRRARLERLLGSP